METGNSSGDKILATRETTGQALWDTGLYRSGYIAGDGFTYGRTRIVKSVPGFAYPLKIVVSAKNQTFTVITNYPFKKGKKHESTIR